MRKGKSKRKCAFGTGKHGIQDPNTALMESQIINAKADYESATDPLSNILAGLGHMGIQVGGQIGGAPASAIGNTIQGVDLVTMAFGGKVEVEGGEIAELPGGQNIEFKGKKHEQGGIDTILPVGTEVFSERIKKEGKTMAQRKKDRDRKLKKLEKKIADDSYDTTAKKSLERQQENFALEEEEDMKIQQLVGALMAPPKDGEEEMAFGGISQGGWDALMGFNNIPKRGPVDLTNNSLPEPIQNSGVAKGSFPGMDQPQSQDFLSRLKEMSEGSTFTSGDGVNMIGNLISTFGPMMNTKKNRAGDTPNENYFENYGEDAIQTIQESKNYLDEQRSDAYMDIDSSKRGLMHGNRQNSRGINTMRAMDIAAELAANKSKRQVDSGVSGSMMEILNREAMLERDQDEKVMSGEMQRDLSDRMDRDVYFTQLAEDLATVGQGLQKTGGDINSTKQNDMMLNILKQMSAFIDMDSKGNMTTKKQS